MKIVKGYVSTNRIGSTCEFEFEIEDDMSEGAIEELAFEAMHDCIEWNYTVEECK